MALISYISSIANSLLDSGSKEVDQEKIDNYRLGDG